MKGPWGDLQTDPRLAGRDAVMTIVSIPCGYTAGKNKGSVCQKRPTPFGDLNQFSLLLKFYRERAYPTASFNLPCCEGHLALAIIDANIAEVCVLAAVRLWSCGFPVNTAQVVHHIREVADSIYLRAHGLFGISKQDYLPY